MNEKKFKLTLNPGMKLVLDNPLEALAMVMQPNMAAALKTVKEGGILRFDAITGAQLREHIENGGFHHDETSGFPLLDDKWYGVLLGAGIAVGPYERKSQAMNGLALAHLGLETEGIIAMPQAETQDPKVAFIGRIKQQLVDQGLPEDVAQMLAEHTAANAPDDLDFDSVEVRVSRPSGSDGFNTIHVMEVGVAGDGPTHH